jgi:hypothetical protein
MQDPDEMNADSQPWSWVIFVYMYDAAGSGADDGPEPGGGLGRLGHDTRRTDGSPAHRCVPYLTLEFSIS